MHCGTQKVTERVFKRGSIWLVDLPPPELSEPGLERPVLILQVNDFNRLSINTIIGIAITTTEKRAGDVGNVLILPEESGLPEVSVVNVSQIITFDKRVAIERIGRLSDAKMEEVQQAVRLWLGL